MRTFVKGWAILFLVKLVYAGNPVDVLPSGGLNTLEDEEILRVLDSNKTEATDNFTFIELIGDLRNHTLEEDSQRWKFENTVIQLTNPYYDDYRKEIDHQASKLVQLVPAYDPGTGNVSAKCKRHADIFHKELSKFTLWALKMYDATAKIPSGLLNGNVNQLGDFDECLSVEGSEGIQGQYCLAYLEVNIDQSRKDLKHLHRLWHSHYAFRSNLSDPGHRVPRYSIINWAICTPASCTPRDVEASLRDILTRHTSQTGLKIAVRVNDEMCQVKSKKPIPRETVYVSTFFAALLTLAVVATCYDHFEIPGSELLLSFSLKRNFKKLVSLERNDDDIATLHGIRAFNALMLIFGHKGMAQFFNPYMNRTSMSESVGQKWTVLGRAASLFTDPFIMLSGLLTCYSFVGKLKRTGSLNIKSEYLSRLFRLMPSLGALILFLMYVMPYIGSGPQWNLVVTHHANICKKTWWKNFLFIHNYCGFEKICLTHTHHLGIDTQLFVVSPLLILFLYKKPKAGVVVLSTLALISTMLRFYVTYVNRLSNYVYFGVSIKQLFDTADLSYSLPTHRATVYIIGILVGYLLRYLPRDYKFSKTTIYTAWTLTTVMFFAAFLGPSKMGCIDYVYEPIDAAIYNAFAPIGWCALFAWVTIAHYTGNTNGWLSRLLAWKGFMVTTRLSYAIYLTQFPTYFFNVGQTRNIQYFNFFRIMFNLSEFFCIGAASVLLTLLVDTPFQNVKNYFFKTPSPERTKLSKVE